MTLTEFLLARIAEDEAVAHEATNDGHHWLVEEETISLWPDDLEPATGNMHFPRKAHAYHAATWEPARVLAECEAKRRIIAAHPHRDADDLGCQTCDWSADWPGSFRSPCPTLRAIAAVYADHPDYDEEWRA